MKPTDFEEAKWLKSFRYDSSAIANREWFLNKYDVVRRFPFPEYFYFKVLNDRCHIHWAIIKEEDNKAVIYFINYRGIVFDKLEYKKVRKAQRELRKNNREMLRAIISSSTIKLSTNEVVIIAKDEGDLELLSKEDNRNCIENALSSFMPFTLKLTFNNFAKSEDAFYEETENIKKIFGDDIVIIK